MEEETPIEGLGRQQPADTLPFICSVPFQCPEGWFPWDNSCYRHEPDILVDTLAGQDYCQNTYNTQLFVPNSKDEADMIKAYLAGVKEYNSIRGTLNYRALIGAKTTSVTRYIEYMDGTVMGDGKFSDSSSTPLGNVHYGMDIEYCLMIDDTGNVQQCNSNRASVLCEMHLSPVDRHVCLDKTTATSSITFNSSTEVTMGVR